MAVSSVLRRMCGFYMGLLRTTMPFDASARVSWARGSCSFHFVCAEGK